MKIRLFILFIGFAFLNASLFGFYKEGSESEMIPMQKSKPKDEKKKPEKDDKEDESKDSKEDNSKSTKDKSKDRTKRDKEKKEGGRFGDRRF